jgi:molybdate transport system substrate-binding protein
MRTLPWVLAVLAAAVLSQPVSGQTTASPPPIREVTVATPGFMYNGGLDVIGKAFQEETGVKVNMKYAGMEVVEAAALDGSADAFFLPADLVDEVAAKGGMKAGSRKRVGRSYQGLAVLKGARIPDISTKAKFVAALEGANRVLYSGSNQANGMTRTARMMAEMFKRPEFAKVKSAVSPYGEGGAALARYEGDMAIQNISQIVIWDNLVVVGPAPEELGMYLDGVAAVSAKAKNPTDGQRFIDYATRPGTFPLWWSRGVDPRKGAP